MPERGQPLRTLGFLTIGLFDEGNRRLVTSRPCAPSSEPSNSDSTASGCATGTCSSASPPRSPYTGNAVRQAQHQYELPAVAGMGVARHRLHQGLPGPPDPPRLMGVDQRGVDGFELLAAGR